MKQYDISVVIPVYNCEKYIRECINSISEQQNFDLKKVQIILINDGSTDGSLTVCKQLQTEFANLSIEIITGKNEGVSSARNKGIKVSKGKYIMFIDADDFISKNAIKNLFDFFEKHYEEVDLITYPMYYKKGRKRKKMNRYTKLFDRKTYIYDLDGEYSHLIQPNVNIMVKNYFENNVLFDENMIFHEDEKYNINILIKKMKIGYVEDAKYIYRRGVNNNATDLKSNPYYCFEDYMSLYEYYIKKYTKEDGHIYKFVQYTIINDIRWRLMQDKILPYYLEKEEFNNAIERIKDILKHIDNEVIVSDRYMDKFHKMYLLKLKGVECDILTNNYNAFSINSNGKILDIIDEIEVSINRFKVKNGTINILGYLKSTIFEFMRPKLYIRAISNENKVIYKEITLNETTASLYRTNMKVAQFYMFTTKIDMSKIKNFDFIIKVGDNSVPIKYYFNQYASINDKINNCKIYDGKYRVEYKEHKGFKITIPTRKIRIIDSIEMMVKYWQINSKINFFRTFAKTKKKIWLYYDRKNVFDNAYVQYKHDIYIKDNIKKYYILDGNIKDYKNKFTRKELKNVVEFGSFKHKRLFLKSDKILTSFSSFQDYCPFTTNFAYYKDLLKYDLIYLQHGILHAKLLRMYSKTSTEIEKIVISSQFEKDNLINNYDYTEKDLIDVGMPRLDEKAPNVEPENKIIFAPSWRKYLIGELINRKREINLPKFKNSKYYIETIKFLTDKKLINVLKENNIILDFKLHPIFEEYKDCFNVVENNNITVSIGNTDLNRYKAFITDFSSFQFDYVNIGRPIVYFVPDMQEFKAGLHTYRELDLPYEKAFGKLCKTGKELVDEVTKLIEKDFKMEPLYKERMENFFYKVDNRKDKLYKKLLEE